MDEFIRVGDRVWSNPSMASSRPDIQLSSGKPGDWWVKRFPGYMCSYLLLRKIADQEWSVLITRDDGKIWVSSVYDSEGVIELEGQHASRVPKRP